MIQRGEILLGVGGGVAAFKAAALCSKLVEAGYAVQTLMTQAATEFIAPLTFEGLTGRAVGIQSTTMAGGKAAHISWSERARCMVVAPATADLMARLSNGLADDAITLTALCFSGLRLFCPAMNDRMWNQPVVQQNANKLVELGWRQLGPVHGRLAEGYEEVGRMVEPEQVVAEIDKLLITARGSA
jgi:phosphopantothenoylcysteine decarboxylase/phosphopantothenate--cysteine ligase